MDAGGGGTLPERTKGIRAARREGVGTGEAAGAEAGRGKSDRASDWETTGGRESAVERAIDRRPRSVICTKFSDNDSASVDGPEPGKMSFLGDGRKDCRPRHQEKFAESEVIVQVPRRATKIILKFCRMICLEST